MSFLAIFFVAFLGKGPQAQQALGPRALAQRAQWQIPVDSLDYSVNPLYIDSLRHSGVDVFYTSRWMNGATCRMTDSLANVVKTWSFVDTVECTRHTETQFTHSVPYPAEGQMPDNCFPLMAICDMGFTNYDSLTTIFDHSHYLGGYDFTDETTSLYVGDHGTQCLSIIAGRKDSFQGAWTDAYYYLMRSEEVDTESPKEGDNMIAALEKADSLGVNVFSASLGYHTFTNADSIWNYTYSMLNGRTTRCSRAAQIAARKGMLLCIAAGNDGSKAWHYLAVPSDADSILCVGAVDSTGQIASFSSRGPSADGRVKPDICEWGQLAPLLTPKGIEARGNGTSYATPRAAGMAARIWHELPGLAAQELRQRIIQSANHYTSSNADYGYGIPNWQQLLDPTDLTEMSEVSRSSGKLLMNGHVVIMRDGKLYDTLGRMIK